MRRLFLLCCLLLTAVKAPLFSSLPWMDNQEKAFELAAKKKKVLFLYFTMPSCPWCKKMNSEILQDSSFEKEVKDLFVFLKVEVHNPSLSPELIQQNQALANQYRVQIFPAVILIDPEKGEISRLGYLPIGGKNYAQGLKELLVDYGKLESALKSFNPKKLEDSFHLAVVLNCAHYREKILEHGIKMHPGCFFLLEKYREYVEQGKKESEPAKEIRLEIEARDPKNVLNALYALAVIDFQTEVANNTPPQKAVQPLVTFLEEFGKTDRKGVWRMQMMVAQFLFSRGLADEALPYARASFKSAPEVVRKQVADLISSIRKQIKSENLLE